MVIGSNERRTDNWTTALSSLASSLDRVWKRVVRFLERLTTTNAGWSTQSGSVLSLNFQTV